MSSMNNEWIEIRDGRNRLLFKYNPHTNEVEFRAGQAVYQIIKLDEIRVKYGVLIASHSVPLGVEVLG